MLWNTVHRHDIRQVDLGRGGARKFDLSLLCGLFQALHRHRILAQVDVVLFLELFGHPVDDYVVEVVTAQVGIAVGRFHFENAVAQFEDRNIERTATEVVYGDFHVLVRFVQAVGQCCGSRLIDDAAYFEARDFAGLFGSLALRVGEVSRNRDDGFAHLGAQVVLRGFFHLLQDDRRDLLRRVFAPFDFYAGRVVVAFDDGIGYAADLLGYLVVSLAHETLDRGDRAFGVRDGLTFGRIAHFPFVIVHECHDRRRRAVSFTVGNHNGLVAFHNGNAGVRGSEVNSDNLSHNISQVY